MFFARVEVFLNFVSNYENWEFCRVDIVKSRVDLLYCYVVCLGLLRIVEESIIEKLRDIVDLLVCRMEEFFVCFQIDLECLGFKGRVEFRIIVDQLSYTIENSLKIVYIVSMFGVFEGIVRRCLLEFGIDLTGIFSNIDDYILDIIIYSLQVYFLNLGYRMMLGYFRVRGFKV